MTPTNLEAMKTRRAILKRWKWHHTSVHTGRPYPGYKRAFKWVTREIVKYNREIMKLEPPDTTHHPEWSDPS